MPIKICFIASHFPQGGAERQITELIKGLLLKDYEISLLLYQSDIIFYPELNKLKIELILNSQVSSRFTFMKWINNILFLRAELKNRSFDILHTYLFYNGALVRLFTPLRFREKIIYSIRNSYVSAPKLFYYLDKLLNKKSINIYNSKKSFVELYPKPSSTILNNNLVIYNGFDVTRFNAINRRDNAILTIGMVGRMTFQKNQIQVLRVLSNLKHSVGLNFKFYIIGDSNLDEGVNIKQFIKKNKLVNEVILLDAQKNIEDYYRKFDVFVMSSIYEGCPNVLFEALLSKCLCIVSTGANSDCFVKNGVDGLVYDGSDQMLELKLKEALVLINNGAANEMIINGYKYATDNFSLTTMIDKYHSVYRKLLK